MPQLETPSAASDDTIRESLLERFEAYSRIADLLATVGVMGFAFNSVTDWKTYIPSSGARLELGAWISAVVYFLLDNGWPPLLAAAAIGTYLAGRIFARKNIGQLRSMFADENTPTGFQVVGRLKLFLMVFGQLALILTMVWYCRTVVVPCVGWIVLHSMYLYSNREQRYWTKRIFEDVKYAPRNSHPHYLFIENRRSAALEYIMRPNDAREYVVICSAVLAIVAALAEFQLGVKGGNTLAYCLMIAGVACNELFAFMWRRILETRLSAANVAQLTADRRMGL